MSTTFKVGDRVKHRRGEAIVVPRNKDFQYVPDDFVCFRILDVEYNDGDHHSCAASELTLVEPAFPPDTRKRLRDITDLADGDVVIIAGVEIAFAGDILHHGTYGYTTSGVLGDMLVDEVRRKPKTKKRRVYEEAAPSEARVGDLITQNVLMGAAKRWSGDREELEGCSVWRLVEETEVPR